MHIFALLPNWTTLFAFSSQQDDKKEKKTPPNYILQLIVTSDAVKTLGASLRCFSQQSL